MDKRIVVACTLLLSTAAHAQSPTFRTETTVVQLPVRVLDCGFVRNLTAADFEVSEEVVPQTISEFSLVDLFAPPKPASGRASGSAVLSPLELEKADGRLYVFLLDDSHVDVTYSARARDLIGGFIRDRMTPNDAAAVFIASGAARQDFTRDKPALLKAVNRFTGTVDGGEPAALQQSRARAVVKLITDLAQALGEIRGRHKTVIYVGSRVGCRVAYEATTDFLPKLKGEQPGPAAGPLANVNSAGTNAAADAADQILCNEELWDAVRAAVQANVSLYALDPRGMTNRGWISPRLTAGAAPMRPAGAWPSPSMAARACSTVFMCYRIKRVVCTDGHQQLSRSI